MKWIRWLLLFLLIAVGVPTNITLYAQDDFGALSWSEAGDKLAVSNAVHALIYRLEGTALNVITLLEVANITAMAWHTDQIAVGTAKGDLSLWDVASARPRRVWSSKASNNAVRDIVWSADGKQLLTAHTDTWASIWQVETGKSLGRIEATGLVFSGAWKIESSEQVVLGGAINRTYEQGFLGIWHTDGNMLQSYTADMRHALKVRDLGGKIAVLTRYEAFVWDHAGDLIEPYTFDLGENATLADADWHGKHFAAIITGAENASTIAWRFNNLERPHLTIAMQLRQARWQPNGDILAILGEDGSITLIDGASGNAIATFAPSGF